MSDNLMKPAYCPSCGASVEGVKPGETHKCGSCGQTSRMAAEPPAPKSSLNITAQVVSIGGDSSGGDMHKTVVNNYGPGATPPMAPAVSPVVPGGFVCPTCKNAVPVKPAKVRPGKKILCPTCGIFSQISADGSQLVPADEPAGDVIGGGGTVTIRTLEVNGHKIRFENGIWTLDGKVVPADDSVLVDLVAKADRAAERLKGLGG